MVLRLSLFVACRSLRDDSCLVFGVRRVFCVVCCLLLFVVCCLVCVVVCWCALLCVVVGWGVLCVVRCLWLAVV